MFGAMILYVDKITLAKVRRCLRLATWCFRFGAKFMVPDSGGDLLRLEVLIIQTEVGVSLIIPAEVDFCS